MSFRRKMLRSMSKSGNQPYFPREDPEPAYRAVKNMFDESKVVFHNIVGEVTDPHCDSMVDSGVLPKFISDWVRFNRLPAHGAQSSENPPPNPFAFLDGRRVVLTMASRFGDIGVRESIESSEKCHGYTNRVLLTDLVNFHEPY